MRHILFFLLLSFSNLFAQNGLLTNVSWSDNLKIILNKDETHCLIWNGKSYGLIYDLATGEQVKEVIFNGYTKDNNYTVHVFEYKNDKATIAGWDNNGLKQEHYFFWDEASNKFYPGDVFASPMHGIIKTIIEDEVVFAFTIYQKDNKGRLNLKKPSHCFVQFYNWKTKKWREFKYPYEYVDKLNSEDLLLFREGNKMKFLDLKTLTFLNKETISFDNILTNYNDGIVYATTYDKGIDKVAPLNEKTFEVGKFSKAPSNQNIDYYWGAMWKYQIKLDRKQNAQKKYDVDLFIKNKKTGLEKITRISTTNEVEINLQKERIQAIQDNRQQSSKDDLNKKYAKQIEEMKDFESNFSRLPNAFTYDYSKAQGRDITNLKMSKRLFLTPNTTVYALGKLFECDESIVFLVMLRGPQAEGTESVYAILKTDHYGNRLQYQIIARTIRNNVGYIQMDEFSVATHLNNNTTISVTENYMGKEKKQAYKFYCLN